MDSPNVSSAEVNRFSDIAEQWWDPSGKFRPLHQLNPLRLRFILEHAHVRDRRILDVGCGGGLLSEALARENASVVGLDVSEQSLQVARLHLKESGAKVDYVCSTAEEFETLDEEKFDIVTCMEVLEHVPDPLSTIQACAKLTKPGGNLFFSTLNRTPKSWILGIVAAEYILNLLPRGTHQYRNFIRPSELNRWCRETGLTLRNITGLHYNPLNQEFSLGPGVDVNYIAHCQRN